MISNFHALKQYASLIYCALCHFTMSCGKILKDTPFKNKKEAFSGS
jgi:hypothetical protein